MAASCGELNKNEGATVHSRARRVNHERGGRDVLATQNATRYFRRVDAQECGRQKSGLAPLIFLASIVAAEARSAPAMLERMLPSA
jgi:hypothetical protein